VHGQEASNINYSTVVLIFDVSGFYNQSLYYAFGEKVFSLNICKAAPKEMALQASSAYKRQEFWRETHTPLWPLIGHIIFSHVKNHRTRF